MTGPERRTFRWDVARFPLCRCPSRHADSIWPIWNVLDVTPDGRGDESNFPSLRYD